MNSQPCLGGCGQPLYVAGGQIAYYHKHCRKAAKPTIKPLIEIEFHKKRPWYFWLKLWWRRTLRRIRKQTI